METNKKYVYYSLLLYYYYYPDHLFFFKFLINNNKFLRLLNSVKASTLYTPLLFEQKSQI